MPRSITDEAREKIEQHADLPTVTQAEIRAVLDEYHRVGKQAQAIGARIRAGAPVEPGEFEADYISAVPPEGLDSAPPCLELYDLDVKKSKPVEQPEWVTETPRDNQYEMGMYAWDGEALQEIYVSREEFIVLKRRLAELRGIEVPDAT
jgi:hypothetical protein